MGEVLIWWLLAYLCGSVPFGYFAGRLRGVDLRKEGSGNIGATNAARVLGKPWGVAVFALDFLKGFAPALLARIWGMPELVQVGAGLCAILGHNFPVWLGFRGGKGIATSAGAIVALYPWQVFAAAVLTWTGLFGLTRIVSVASIGAAVIFPVVTGVLWYLGQCGVLFFGLSGILSLLAIWKHRSNIQRLLAGTEPRFEKKGKKVEVGENGEGCFK